MLLALTFAACGSESRESAPAEEPEATEPAETEAADPEAADEATDEATVAEPVDLLHAVGTELAVSSAYRDSMQQVAHLVDGDLETAWNSRTGDLVGSWIEVRVPRGATVTGLRLTVGFTKTQGQRDLFEGNHRIRRVRVSRDGEALGEHELDPSSRELQGIEVTGPGGVYRIEILEVVPGDNERWREICVTELRVLGTAEGAAEGERFPRFAIGELPPPSTEAPSEPAAAARSLREAMDAFGRAYQQLERDTGDDARASDLDLDDYQRSEYRNHRALALRRVAEAVAPVDAARADRLRAASWVAVPWGELSRVPQTRARLLEDVQLAAAALAALAERAGGDAPCRAARWSVARVLDHVAQRVQSAAFWAEHDVLEPGFMGEDARPEDESRADRLADLRERVEALHGQWRAHPERTAQRLRQIDAPEDGLDELWSALTAALDRADRRCGGEGDGE